jgi:hypothetical protein
MTTICWSTLALQLLRVRRQARWERSYLGHIQPYTKSHMEELLAKAEAAFVIDDAMRKEGVHEPAQAREDPAS